MGFEIGICGVVDAFGWVCCLECEVEKMAVCDCCFFSVNRGVMHGFFCEIFLFCFMTSSSFFMQVQYRWSIERAALSGLDFLNPFTCMRSTLSQYTKTCILR